MGLATAVTAAASIGGSMLQSRAANRASQRAADAQLEAANQASQVQRQNFLDTMQMLQPRIRAGDTALGQMMFELGLSDQPGIPMPQQGGGARGARGVASQLPQPDYEQYVADNPDLQAEYQRVAGGGFGPNLPSQFDLNRDGRLQANEYGMFHFNRFGQREGRALPMNGMVPNGTPQAYQANTPAPAQDPADRFARFRETPGYQFALEEGVRGIDASAASRGMLLRGSTLRRLQEYGQGLADQTYGQYFNRLAQVAGGGGQAVGQAANLGQSTANNLAQIATGAGGARASSYLQQGATNTQNIGNIAGVIGDVVGGMNFNGWGKKSAFMKK